MEMTTRFGIDITTTSTPPIVAVDDNSVIGMVGTVGTLPQGSTYTVGSLTEYHSFAAFVAECGDGGTLGEQVRAVFSQGVNPYVQVSSFDDTLFDKTGASASTARTDAVNAALDRFLNSQQRFQRVPTIVAVPYEGAKTVTAVDDTEGAARKETNGAAVLAHANAIALRLFARAYADIDDADTAVSALITTAGTVGHDRLLECGPGIHLSHAPAKSSSVVGILCGLRARLNHEGGQRESMLNKSVAGVSGLAVDASFDRSGQSDDIRRMYAARLNGVYFDNGWKSFAGQTGADGHNRLENVQAVIDLARGQAYEVLNPYVGATMTAELPTLAARALQVSRAAHIPSLFAGSTVTIVPGSVTTTGFRLHEELSVYGVAETIGLEIEAAILVDGGGITVTG